MSRPAQPVAFPENVTIDNLALRARLSDQRDESVAKLSFLIRFTQSCLQLVGNFPFGRFPVMLKAKLLGG